MLDILKNLFSDPINIPDERLRSLLFVQDGLNPDNCKAFFKIEAPYSPDRRKAGTTPAILVSAGQTQYPSQTVNVIVASTGCPIGANAEYGDHVMRICGLSIAVLTESCDGTQLLADIIEDFLVTYRRELSADAPADRVDVVGSSGIEEINTASAANAKPLYQIVLSVQVAGGISWRTDTQGPVYRGMSTAIK